MINSIGFASNLSDDSTAQVNALPDTGEMPIGLPPGLDERPLCNLHAQLAKFLAHYPTEGEALDAFRRWCEDRIQTADREFRDEADADPEIAAEFGWRRSA